MEKQNNQDEPVALPVRNAGFIPSHMQVHGDPWNFVQGWNACVEQIEKLGPLYTRPVQGEPVAWMNFDGEGGHDFTQDQELAEHWRKSNGKYDNWLTPLYTHADPGEVERLRAELEVTKKLYAEACQASYDFGAMQTKLAERDALLRDRFGSIRKLAERACGRPKDSPEYRSFIEAINPTMLLDLTALSASAEPSAPVERDERAEFDPIEWLETEIIAVDTWYRGSPSYEHDAGWMKDQALRLVAEARAALERKPS